MTEPLHAWTIQPMERWNALQRRGILRADGRRVWNGWGTPRTADRQGTSLLLDFETWQCVLNGWPLPLTWREDREIERRPLSRREIQKTWERVFDLPALRRSKLWGGASRVQGVVEYLLLDEVVGLDRFVAR